MRKLHATFDALLGTQREMTLEEDERLLRRISTSGDETAFRVLYQKHTPFLYRLALRLLGGAVGEAEDAVQESWIRVLGGLATFRKESSFRTWVSGVLVNTCRETRRSREPRGTDEGVEPAGPSPSDAVRIDLERAVSSLPNGYRDVLVLHDIQGYTHEDIGRLLGIEAGTSKSQLSRARRALRESLSRPSALRAARAGGEGA